MTRLLPAAARALTRLEQKRVAVPRPRRSFVAGPRIVRHETTTTWFLSTQLQWQQRQDSDIADNSREQQRFQSRNNKRRTYAHRWNSTTTTTSMDSKWRDMTDRILEHPVGTMDAGKWNEATNILDHWLSSRDADFCWRILDQLCDELDATTTNHQKRHAPRLPLPAMDVLNPILIAWRDDFQRTHSSNNNNNPPQRLAPQVSEQLLRYQAQNLVKMDAASHAIVLDVAGKQSSSSRGGNNKSADHEQGVWFADRYLREWIDRYQSQVTGCGARPDIVAFGTVIHAWVESGLPNAPQKAEEWLQLWDDFSRKVPSSKEESKRYLYTFVLLAWAKAGNPSKAREWIDRMVREQEYPDVQAYNCLLMAYQSAAAASKEKKQHHAQHAEDVLRHMQQLYHDENGFLKEPPNVVSYNIVIDAWTKRAHPKATDAAKRAHEWMDRMKVAGVPPNTVTYNTVITAYSRAGQPLQSEEILKEMITVDQNNVGSNTSSERHETNNNKNHVAAWDSSKGLFNQYASMTTTKPDVQSFTSVVAGWARVGTSEAAERAEELLRTMQTSGIPPNVETYGSCIHCWARAAAAPRGNKKRQNRAVERAEALFEEMTTVFNISPDVYAYTGLVNAYGRSGRAERAQEFLETCLAEYDRTKDPRMKPTVVTFTAILNAWSKARGVPNAAEKAHELLHRMSDVYGIEPNAFSYSAVLDAYALSDQADKALELFREMREVRKLEPNAYTCSNVLKAMARGGKTKEAQDLLFELVSTVKLGAHAFSAVLYGFSKSKERDAPLRAESLLEDMEEMYEDERILSPPNAVCFNNVLACWAHSRLPESAERADQLFQSLRDRAKYGEILYERRRNEKKFVRVNRIMYNTVMNALANKGDTYRTLELFEEFVDHCSRDPTLDPPDEYTYRALWKSIVRTKQMLDDEKLFHLVSVAESMAKSGLRLEPSMEADLEAVRNIVELY